jgi:hypothetical protein
LAGLERVLVLAGTDVGVSVSGFLLDRETLGYVRSKLVFMGHPAAEEG